MIGIALFAPMALLPLYAGEPTGEWSNNMAFRAELHGNGAQGFCVLRTAIDESSNGIEFRLGLSFGARNEISLATTSESLAPSGPITVALGDDEFTFSDLSKETVAGTPVLRWRMSRSMMGKVLKSLRGASAASLTLPLKAAPISFHIPTQEIATTLADAKACEDHRLGRVLVD